MNSPKSGGVAIELLHPKSDITSYPNGKFTKKSQKPSPLPSKRIGKKFLHVRPSKHHRMVCLF